MAEYRDWQLYLATGTTLEQLLDVHLARIASILSNRFRRNNTAAQSYKKFLLLPQAPQVPLTGEQFLAKVILANAALGGEFIDKRGNH